MPQQGDTAAMPRYVIERNFPDGLGLAPDEKGRHVETEKLLQIDFAGGRPVRAGDQFCFGQVR